MTEPFTQTLTCRNHPDVIEALRNCARCGGTFCGDCLVELGGISYCGTCKNEQLRDIRSGVDHAAINLASAGRRFAAIWIDWILLGIPLWIAMIIFMMPEITRGVMPDVTKYQYLNLLYLPVFFVYDGLMTALRGQTVGKIALKIRVISADGAPVSGLQAWGRALVRAALISLLALVNYIPIFFTKEKTCVHDMLAKTRVVNVT